MGTGMHVIAQVSFNSFKNVSMFEDAYELLSAPLEQRTCVYIYICCTYIYCIHMRWHSKVLNFSCVHLTCLFNYTLICIIAC